MLYYLLHQSPLWYDMEDGKRNVRVLFIALNLYIFGYMILHQLKDTNVFANMLFTNYYLFFLADAFCSAILYKLYYGRTVLSELDPQEEDIFDNETHKYYKKEHLEDLLQRNVNFEEERNANANANVNNELPEKEFCN